MLLFLALALLLAGPARAEPEAAAPPPVVFLSDFGTGDDAVAAVKGVMLGIDPRLQVIDLTHQVRPYAIADGARLLADTAPYYPKGTVFLAVVDLLGLELRDLREHGLHDVGGLVVRARLIE